MRRLGTVFSLLSLILLPTLLQAQLLQDADRIIMRLRTVCNYGQGGPLVIALDIKPRVNGTERRVGGYNVVIAYSPSKLVMQGVQERYETGYWPGGAQYLDGPSGAGIGTWYNQRANGWRPSSSLPITDQYFEVTTDCASNPLNDQYFELLRYNFTIQPSATGTVNIAFMGWQPWRSAGPFLVSNEVTAMYYSDLGNNGNDSLKTIVGLVVPVELSAFTATALPDRSIELRWRTESEENNYGFEIQRSLGEKFEAIAFVPGKGTTNAANEYSYTDLDVRNAATNGNPVLYRLRQIDNDGAESFTEIAAAQLAPEAIALGTAYPNPAVSSSQVTIPYSVALPAGITLAVFNALGESVATLAQNEPTNAGTYKLIWDGTSDAGAAVPAGVYFIRFNAQTQNGQSVTQIQQIQVVR